MSTSLASILKKQALNMKDDLVKYRRHIHEHPELGFEEENTAQYIISILEDLGVPYKSGIAKTGIVATIKGSESGKTLLIRADMDALPVHEENDVPYKSKIDGKMHACGHDAHVASLLGAIRLVNEHKDKLKGTVHFVFQPAEEGPGGARPMVDSGVFGDREHYEIDLALALHVVASDEVGEIVLKPGELTASSDEFHFIIEGVGGHASAPHQAIDPVFIGAQVVTSTYAWLTRYVDPVSPVVYTVGRLSAGTRHNIIPNTAEIDATLRTLDPELREDLLTKIPEITQKIVETYGAKLQTQLLRGYPVGINDPKFTEIVINAASEIIGRENVKHQEKPIMGSEDFFEFGIGKIPTVMFWLGAGNKEKGLNAPNHSPHFDIDENALPIGSSILALIALQYKDNM